MKRLEEDEYVDTQAVLMRAGGVVALLELDAFIGTLDEAHAIGPIVVPTAYREAMTNMRDLRELAEAAEKVKAVWLRMQARLTREQEARSGARGVAVPAAHAETHEGGCITGAQRTARAAVAMEDT